MAFSAGTAYLQVVPSFLGVESAMRQEAQRMGRTFEESIGRSIPRGMAEGARAARPQGARAGEEYGGALADAMHRRLEAGLRDLPKAKPEIDANAIDEGIAAIRARMEELRNQKIGFDIDEATAFAAIEAIHADLQRLERDAPNIHQFINLRAAREQVAALDELAQEARQKGFTAGENFGGAFADQATRRIEAGLRALPDVRIGADTSDAERQVAVLRAQLAEVRDLHIHGEIDDAQLLAKLALLRAHLDELAARTTSIPLRYNVEAAREQLDRLIADVGPRGEQAAEQFAGAFGSRIQTRLAAALRSLPTATITVDSSEAERRLAQVRAEIATLSSQHIGVDIDAGEAFARVAELRVQLVELSRNRSVDFQVRADAAAAAGELTAIVALEREVDRNAPRIRIDSSDADRASISMRQFAATFNLSSGQLIALVALGPAMSASIVPAAVASAAAVASIGSAAIASAAVAILGLSGVGKALSAMVAYQNSAAKSATSLTTSQNQVAGGLDSVNSAERSLANTRASVASASANAARQVTDANRSLTDAERQLHAAQQAVNQAFEEARRAQEDLADQVKDNSLSQRQAALDVKAAKSELDKVLGDPRSTADQREQARITFEQRTQQLSELGRQGQRLAEDQRHSDRVGIEGSQQVVAARERVRSATESVRKAQEQVAAAQQAQADQARQGAFQVAQAQQAVINAQRQLADASSRAGIAGGAALDTMQTALENLSPPARRFAEFLFSLRPELNDLRASAASGLLPGLEDGIRAMLPLLPQFETDIDRLSHALGGLGSEAGHALASPYWRTWSHDILAQSVPAMQTGAHAVGLFAIGLAGLARALVPLGLEVGQGVLNFAARFALANNQLGQSRNFQALMQFVRAEGPEAAQTIEDVARAAVTLVRAFSPLGSPTFTILRVLAGLLNGLPIGVLQFAAQAAAAFWLAMKAWDLFKVVRDSTALFNVMYSFSGVFSGARIAMQEAQTAGVGPLSRGLIGLRSGASGAATGIGELASIVGVSGPLGVGLLAVTGLVTGLVLLFSHASQAAAQQRADTEQLSGALQGLANAQSGGKEKTDEYLQNLVKTDEKFRDMLIHTRDLGVGVNIVSAAVHGNAAALATLNKAYDNQIAKAESAKRGVVSLHVAGSDYAASVNFQDEIQKRYGLTLDEYIARLKSEKAAADAAADAAKKQAEAFGILGGATDHVTAVTDDNAIMLGRLSAALLVVSDHTATTSDKISALKQAEDALNGATQSVADAQHQFAGGSLQLRDALDQATAAGVNAKNVTDDYTAAGHNLNDALIGQVKNAMDVYNATLAQTGSVDQANKAYQDYLAKIQADIDKSPLDQAEKEKVRAKLQEIVDTQGRIPTDPKVMQVKLSGDDQVISQMAALAILQRSLSMGVSLQEAKTQYEAEQRINQNFGHLATGGPVRGAGGPIDDQIPAMLSNGEHVWTAREVIAAGGHAAVQKLRNLVLTGVLEPPRTRYPGDGSQGIAYAHGGPVLRLATGGPAWHPGMPLPVDVSHTKVPTLAQIIRAVQYGPAYGGPLTDRARFAQTWVKGQEGKPYIWASAGPRGYDCSGIQSAVFNILAGHPIYNHTFSTFDEGRYFTKPGYGMFTVGWTNPGERGPGGSSVGHTAGKIGNLAFESRGGDGVVIGPRVTSLSAFAHLAHLAHGGPVEPIVADSGAWLAPGWNPPIINNTGRPEPVVPPDTFTALVAAANRPSAPQAGNTYQFAFRDTTLTSSDLRAIQDRDAALARVGRAR